MVQITLKTKQGDVEINIPPPGDFPSRFVFAMHKSGSTLLNKMLGNALRLAKVPQIAPGESAFSAGLSGNQLINPQDFVFERGYCYRGYRMLPPYLQAMDISKNKKILLVRDPRDMLVSHYFSTAFSHVVPETGGVRDKMLERREAARTETIDEYVLSRTDFFSKEFAGYEPLLGTELRTYRYEDVIFDKANWLTDMLRYFEVDLAPKDIEKIAAKHDVRPDEERPDQHVRQVTPGNYKKHLHEETIAKLNDIFSRPLNQYGYTA